LNKILSIKYKYSNIIILSIKFNSHGLEYESTLVIKSRH